MIPNLSSVAALCTEIASLFEPPPRLCTLYRRIGEQRSPRELLKLTPMPCATQDLHATTGGCPDSSGPKAFGIIVLGGWQCGVTVDKLPMDLRFVYDGRS